MRLHRSTSTHQKTLFARYGVVSRFAPFHGHILRRMHVDKYAAAHGGTLRVMEYNMQHQIEQTIEVYKELVGREVVIKDAPTPFLDLQKDCIKRKRFRKRTFTCI